MQDLKSKDFSKVQQAFNKISKNIDLENLSIFTPILDELSDTSLLFISLSDQSSEKSKQLAEKLKLEIERKNKLTESAEDSSDVSILTLEREEDTDSRLPLTPKENVLLQSKPVSGAPAGNKKKKSSPSSFTDID